MYICIYEIKIIGLWLIEEVLLLYMMHFYPRLHTIAENKAAFSYYL
jgi:hypothetical protein